MSINKVYVAVRLCPVWLCVQCDCVSINKVYVAVWLCVYKQGLCVSVVVSSVAVCPVWLCVQCGCVSSVAVSSVAVSSVAVCPVWLCPVWPCPVWLCPVWLCVQKQGVSGDRSAWSAVCAATLGKNLQLVGGRLTSQQHTSVSKRRIC